MMKRALVVALSLMFLAGTATVWADANTTPVKSAHKTKHRKKRKPKNELNPQPLPPRKLPGNNGGSGAPPNGSSPKADTAQ